MSMVKVDYAEVGGKSGMVAMVMMMIEVGGWEKFVGLVGDDDGRWWAGEWWLRVLGLIMKLTNYEKC